MSNYRKTMAEALREMYPIIEDVDLDEGTKQVLAHGGKGQYKAVRDGDITKIMYKGKVVGTADFDSGADSFFASIKGEKGQRSFDDAQAMVDYFAKKKITEEVELDEKPADFIRLSFSSPADVKKAKKWMDQNLPGANQGFTGMDASGKDIEFEGVDDAEDLMAKLKKAGFKFKMDYREEVDLDEQLAKIKGNTPADKGRKSAVEDDIERAEKKGDKKEVEKLKEEDIDEAKMTFGTKRIPDAMKKKGMDKVKTKGLNKDKSSAAYIGKMKKEEEDIDEAKKKPVSQMTPKEKEADAARRKEYKTYQKSKRNEELGEKFTKKDFRDNEDSNHHTENGVEIVNMYGTPAEKKLMAQIAKNHDKNREISQKEQKLRDAMVKKYYSKLESVDLDEANMNKKQMMDMVTKDAKSGLGKIVHKVVDSGNRFEIQVHQDDERDAQKAMKMNPLYIAGKLRVVPALGESKVIPESNDLISQTVNLITYTQMQEKQDSADVDDDASQKDVDDAAKNIIMQLRKSVSMRGDKEVEFAAIGHGYKKKVDMKIAQKALDMYNKMKPQDKTKFQTTIAKSYKDLLNAIKGK